LKAYEQSIALGHAMGKVFGVNYDFGMQLHIAVLEAGFGSPEFSRYICVDWEKTGGTKRLLRRRRG
jgi:hypothetical protein